MIFLVGLCHSGDSIAGMGNSYFFQAYGWSAVGNDVDPDRQSAATYYSTDLISRNMGVAGTRLAGSSPNLTGLAPLYIDPIIPVGYASPPFDRERRYIFTTAIGSNDGAINGYANPVLYAGAVATQCVVRKSAGYNLVGICTLLPRNDGVMTEPNRLLYNTTVKNTTWQHDNSIDFCIDLASQSTMGNPANCGDPTWYVDGVHPTDAGFALLAPIFASGISAAIALLSSQGTTMSVFTPLTYQGEIPTSDSLNRALNQLQTQISALGGGSGTVTSFSFVNANGFTGSVATATSTPALTLTAAFTLTTTGSSGAATYSAGTLNIPQYSGGSSGITIGTTTITSGSSTRLLYDAAGVVGESSGVTTDGASLTITPAANTTALTLASSTQTASNPALSVTQTWNNAGVSFTAVLVNITSTASLQSSPLIDLQVATVSKFNVDRGGNITSVGSMTLTGGITTGASQFLAFGNRGDISAPSDGVFKLENGAGTDFGRLQFGGTTSSFPALKRSTTNLQVRLADDSTYAPIDASAYKVGGVAGVSFGPSVVTSITVVNGIITAIS